MHMVKRKLSSGALYEDEEDIKNYRYSSFNLKNKQVIPWQDKTYFERGELLIVKKEKIGQNYLYYDLKGKRLSQFEDREDSVITKFDNGLLFEEIIHLGKVNQINQSNR